MKRRARLIAQMFVDLFRGKNANGVARGIEHVITARVGAHRDRDADAIAFGILDERDDFLELAGGREALDAGGRAGFRGEDVTVRQDANAFGFAAAAEIAGLHFAGFAELGDLLAVAVVVLNRVPRVMWNP